MPQQATRALGTSLRRIALVDTSGQLVEAAHNEAASAMIAAGLTGTMQGIARRRRELGLLRPGEDVDALLVDEQGGNREIAAVGRKAFYDRRIDKLEPFPGTVETLRALRPGRKLGIVTIGDPRTQRRKLDLLGIASLVDEVVIVDLLDGDKERVFAELLTRWEIAPAHALVVGDRLDREIAAGRRLGCWTLRIDHGEGKHALPRNADEQPHYTTEGIEGVVAVVEDIESEEERCQG